MKDSSEKLNELIVQLFLHVAVLYMYILLVFGRYFVKIV